MQKREFVQKREFLEIDGEQSFLYLFQNKFDILLGSNSFYVIHNFEKEFLSIYGFIWIGRSCG